MGRTPLLFLIANAKDRAMTPHANPRFRPSVSMVRDMLRDDLLAIREQTRTIIRHDLHALRKGSRYSSLNFFLRTMRVA
jgi:hypothetical protein